MAKRAPLMCRNGCGQQIWFDWERKFDDLGYTSNSSKPNIPLEVSETGEHLPKKHQCPNSTYGKQEYQQQQQPQQQQQQTSKQVSAPLSQETVYEILGKIEKIGLQIDAISTTIHQQNESTLERLDQVIAKLRAQAMPHGEPLDDEGELTEENRKYDEGEVSS